MHQVRNLVIREETPDDHAQVFLIHKACFETTAEATLVETLRKKGDPVISLVACLDRSVVGHILFSRATVNSTRGTVPAMALGPLAVLARFRKRGIGSALVREGFRSCLAQAHSLVFVVGDPDFYRRFGFQSASPLGLHYAEPRYDPFFMVSELQPGGLTGCSGLVEYLPEFRGH